MDPTALLFLTQIPNPPIRPPVVEERLLLSKKGEAVQRIGERAVSAYSSYADDWTRKIDAAKAMYQSIPIVALTEADAAILSELITDVESLAEVRARGTETFRKKAARDVKKMRDPSIAAVSRDVARKLLGLDEMIIEKLLDYALFLRSARAERLPDNTTTAAFSDPAEVRAFLKRQAA